jgi:hypothetical protein
MTWTDFLEFIAAANAWDNMCVTSFTPYETEIARNTFITQPFSAPLNVELARSFNNKIDVYIVSEEGQSSGMLKYKVKYRNGTMSGVYEVTPVVINDRISKATLDLTAINNPADALEIQFGALRSCYAVPQGVSFNAYAYLPDNKMMLSFDQTGRYREQVYDEFGDIVQVTDNKNLVTVNAVSYQGKGTPESVFIPVTIPVKIYNDANYMYAGPVLYRLALHATRNGSETVAESDMPVVPGQEYIFNGIKQGKYWLELQTENPFTKLTVNGQLYEFARPGIDHTVNFIEVDLSAAQELIIRIDAPFW